MRAAPRLLLALLAGLGAAQALAQDFRLCQLDDDRILILSGERRFLLHKGTVSWELAEPKQKEAFAAFRRALRGRPETGELIENALAGDLGKRLPLAGTGVVRRTNDRATVSFQAGKARQEIAFALRPTGTQGREDWAIDPADRPKLERLSGAFRLSTTQLTKKLAQAGISGRPWASFIDAVSKEPRFVLLSDSQGVFELKSRATPTVATTPRTAPPTEPAPRQGGIPAWVWPLTGGLLLIAFAAGAWFFLRRGVPGGRGAARRPILVSPTERELLGYYRALVKRPDDDGKPRADGETWVYEQVQKRFNRYPQLEADYQDMLRKYQELEANLAAAPPGVRDTRTAMVRAKEAEREQQRLREQMDAIRMQFEAEKQEQARQILESELKFGVGLAQRLKELSRGLGNG